MSPKKPESGRYEYKYAINKADYQILLSRLMPVLGFDSHADTSGDYHIRSLYFETPGDKALREKIDGVNRREKFRIRIYNHSDQFIKLEKKCKINGLCYKSSARLTAEETKAAIAGDFSWIREEHDGLVTEFYAKTKYQQLKPCVLVDYVRKPFVYPAGNVRITLDRDIRTSLRLTDIFNKALPTVPANDGTALLEVKYTGFIPDIITKLVQLDNRRAGAFSKYAQCRIYG